MANVPRPSLFVPRRDGPYKNDEKLVYGSPATLTAQKPPRFQPYQFWPEVRLRNWDEKVTFRLGTATALIALKPPRFQPYQFWPDVKLRRRDEVSDFDLGTNTDLINVKFLPRFQPFQFWPEARPPRMWEERNQFSLGSPGPLIYLNLDFPQVTFWPEIRLPVVPQPSVQGTPPVLLVEAPSERLFLQPETKAPVPSQPFVQGSPESLLTPVTVDKPVGSQQYYQSDVRPTVVPQPTDQGTPLPVMATQFLPEFQPFQFWPEVRLPVVPHQPTEQGSPATLVNANPLPQQIFTLRPEIRFPVVDQPAVQGTPHDVLDIKPVGGQALSLPEIRLPVVPHQPTEQGTPTTITSLTFEPEFQPYQFWPEVRLRRRDEITDFTLGTSSNLTSFVFLPVFQNFQFWPEARPPRNWEERPTNFKIGSPATLVNPNSLPQQIFTLRPEIRFPVVDQPPVQGSPNPLLNDKPVGKQTPFQPEVRLPVVPHQPTSQGSPGELFFTNEKPFQQFVLKPEVVLPVVPHEPPVQGSPDVLLISPPPTNTPEYSPYQFWPEVRLPVVPHQPAVQGTPSDLVYTNEKPFQQFALKPEVRLPVVPDQPTVQGTPETLTRSVPPQPYQFWPDVRAPVVPHQPSVQGTPSDLTHTNEKPFQQFVLKPEIRLPVVDQPAVQGSPDTIIETPAVQPQYQPFQFWPEVRRPVVPDQPSVQGTPNELTHANEKPFQQFVLKPEVRLPVIPDQPSVQGSPTSLIVSPPPTNPPEYSPFQFWPEVRLPVVPHQPFVQGSPSDLVYANDKPFQQFVLKPEIRLPVVDQLAAQGSPESLLSTPPTQPQYQPFQLWPDVRAPVVPHQPTVQGSPNDLVYTNDKPNQPFAFLADTRPEFEEPFNVVGSPTPLLRDLPVGKQLPLNLEIALRSRDQPLIGSSIALTSGVVVTTPSPSFEFWPDVRLPVVPNQPSVQGTPNYLIRDNPKPFQIFVLRPEIRFPAVHQPSLLGTSNALLYAPPFVPPEPTPVPPEPRPTSGGVYPPAFARPPQVVNVVIDGITLTCYTYLEPGITETISYFPGHFEISAIAKQSSSSNHVRIKFTEVDKKIDNSIIDKDLEDFLFILSKLL